uniref:Uncharacterized protein n=1 Tax=Triticum urartu TaxID=4572 RepID=A0A8R7Q352_TRIUA
MVELGMLADLTGLVSTLPTPAEVGPALCHARAIWSNSLQCHNTLLDLSLAFLLPADESFRDANCLPSENQKNERMGFIAYMLYVQLMKL